MRIATVIDDPSDYNLRLVAQAGVDEIVLRYPTFYGMELPALNRRVTEFGLKVGVIEGYLPLANVKTGAPEREAELAQTKTLLEQMGALSIPVLCYNFMAGSDWNRTSTTHRERGGALVTAYEAGREPVEPVDLTRIVSAEQLWDNLTWFLERATPVAAANGVFLAMHPDDPPLAEVSGQARIMNSVAAFERLVQAVDHPANAICFCQGTFAEMGVDIPATIHRLGQHIRYVHFRDIRWLPNGFVETFHDNGMTDMAAAMRAYRDIGFSGAMRPDHVPQLVGEEDGNPGYTMLGRLQAFGYMRGLMHGIA